MKTCALAMGTPAWSVTVPSTLPVVCCAARGGGRRGEERGDPDGHERRAESAESASHTMRHGIVLQSRKCVWTTGQKTCGGHVTSIPVLVRTSDELRDRICP